MLQYLIDMNKELYEQISQKDSQLTEIEKVHVAEKERLKAAHEATQAELGTLSDEIKTNNEKFSLDRLAFEKKYNKATEINAKRNNKEYFGFSFKKRDLIEFAESYYKMKLELINNV